MTESTQVRLIHRESQSCELTFATLQEMVAECLGLDVAEVLPDSKFFDDLGGESIDLIDLTFQFEKVFQVKVPFKALANKELLERDTAGAFTPAALDVMRRDFPGLDLDQRLASAGSSNLQGLLTIELMFQMVLHAPNQACQP